MPASSSPLSTVGTALRRPVIYPATSTNQKSFREFLELVKAQVKPELCGTGKPRVICLMDNHSAHKTSLSKKALERKFTPLF